ncbi:ribonucleoside-triphosphate reductase (plasmid) [Geoalkalibacter subterraneus]|uniref:Ribonucleoside-triphosphate reductase n=1 Tax=Geoalkalibacter subterraneus TaxID=483547 RepID=A0A0B5FXK1_9BACT|nr:ribonucleoside-triphosphate reductase [Geoalkalibacter subterraneus]
MVPFSAKPIFAAIKKAVIACGGSDFEKVARLTSKVVEAMNDEFAVRTASLSVEESRKAIHSVEEIQDLVVKALIKGGHDEVGLAYVKYRLKRAELREGQALVKASVENISAYVGDVDWQVKENANMGYSVQGLNIHIAEEATKAFWLHQYSTDVKDAHVRGDMHMHDLGFLGNYCCGWDLKALLLKGFNGVAYKVAAGPAKHLDTALLQLVNFLYTMQGESAGAQAVSNFDTLLAPFVRHDGLSYKQVKRAMQQFIFNMNVPTRVGFQTPFTNITLDLFCPSNMADEAVVVGGELQETTYGQYQEEMDMINRAFCEVMMAGDSEGRIFSYPIPTFNVSKDWDWSAPQLEWPFQMAAKFGIPYFSNFINSDMDPEDARSMCCRLRLDNTELLKRGGGLFGANPLTGSIGVVTLNLPLAAYEAGDKDGFLTRIAELIDLASESLELKRKILEGYFDQGLYPYSKAYLADVKARTGQYLANHFSTIGLVGMHEALLNLGIEGGITSKEGHTFAVETLTFMRENIQAKQIATGNLYNLEATPAESTCYRLAKKALKVAPKIIVSGDEEPYFTNSSQLPVGYTEDIFEALTLQDDLQTQYTGGTVLHGFLGEQIEDWKMAMMLVKKSFTNFKLPYLSLTPTFSICSEHGYLAGEHFACPHCGKDAEVWSRVTGFYRPVQAYNPGKQQEYRDRSEYQLNDKDEAVKAA